MLSHPTLPLTITAHEDRHIRFYDNTTGALVHRYKLRIDDYLSTKVYIFILIYLIYLSNYLSSMVAHLDVVTSLAVNQHCLYLIYLSIYLSSIVAHLDAVTSLTVDQHGLYLISLSLAIYPSTYLYIYPSI